MNPGLIYLGVPLLMYVMQGCVVYIAEKRYGMALTMLAYAIANVGLIMDLYGI